jgi:gliding motility-associated-like protein
MKKIILFISILVLTAGNFSAQSNVLVIDYANGFSSDLSNNASHIYNRLLATQTSVTRVFAIPPTISTAQYDQVWIFGNMGFPNPTTLNPVIAYMNNGGAVYVQSEIGCCNNQAAFVDQLIDSTVTIGNTISHSMIKTSYYEYSSFPTLRCTPIVSHGAALRPFVGAPQQNVLLEATPTCGTSTTTGDIVGVRFCHGDMISGKGALISVGDFNIFPAVSTCTNLGLMGTPNNDTLIDFISDLLPKLACDTPSQGGLLVLTATPQVFCGSTQLGWNYTPGSGGCGIIGCPTDTSYKWSVVSGEPINVPVNFSCDTCPYPIASPSIVTTYMLTITVGDTTGSCTNGFSAQIPITVTPLPMPSKGPVTINADCNGNVDLSISGYQGSLQWQMSSGAGPWNNISGATLDTLSQTGISSGDCFRVEISTSCGTTISDSVCVGSLTNPITGTVSHTIDCNGAVAMYISGYSGDLQWQSSTGSGPFMDVPGGTLDSLLHSGINPGDCFRAKIATTCDTVYSDTICPIIPTSPINGVIGYNADCKGNIELWVDSAQGNIQWQSSIASGPWTDIAGGTLDSISQSGINTGDCFRVMIYTVCDTLYTDTVCPTMLVGPTAAFSYAPPGNSQSNVPMSFTDLSTGNIVSWQWDFGDNSPSGNTHIPNPTHTYHNDGSYTVTLIVTDANGCTDTISVIIEVVDPACNGKRCIIVPNVFTPNGDGNNDFLVFKHLEKYDNYLSVYNRWGTLIYEQDNYKNQWDGGEISEGSYFFILDVIIDNKTETYKGVVNVLR